MTTIEKINRAYKINEDDKELMIAILQSEDRFTERLFREQEKREQEKTEGLNNGK